jgi:hypothetical protein
MKIIYRMLCLGILLVSCNSKTSDIEKRLLEKENVKFKTDVNTTNKAKKSISEQNISIEKSQKKQVKIECFFEDKVILKGKLEEIKYTDLNDSWHNAFVLFLENNIKVISKSENYETQENVSEVQIYFDFDKVKTPKNYLNKTITLSGELYGEQTVHDRRPVVMINATIK